MKNKALKIDWTKYTKLQLIEELKVYENDFKEIRKDHKLKKECYEETIKNLSQWITDLKKVNKELLNEVSELEDNVADFVHNDRPELSESELSDYPNVISLKSYKLRKAA